MSQSSLLHVLSSNLDPPHPPPSPSTVASLEIVVDSNASSIHSKHHLHPPQPQPEPEPEPDHVKTMMMNSKNINNNNNNKLQEDHKCSSCCVIDIHDDDVDDGVDSKVGRLCRICHLTAKETGKLSVPLSHLGCGCKGELALAHPHCAEAWFKIRGNRICEICGQTAKNVTGVVTDNAFMDEWNENRSVDTAATATLSDHDTRRCLRGQPLCNLLMACLVIAFVLPWFFRVNMF